MALQARLILMHYAATGPVLPAGMRPGDVLGCGPGAGWSACEPLPPDKGVALYRIEATAAVLDAIVADPANLFIADVPLEGAS